MVGNDTKNNTGHDDAVGKARLLNLLSIIGQKNGLTHSVDYIGVHLNDVDQSSLLGLLERSTILIDLPVFCLCHAVTKQRDAVYDFEVSEFYHEIFTTGRTLKASPRKLGRLLDKTLDLQRQLSIFTSVEDLTRFAVLLQGPYSQIFLAVRKTSESTSTSNIWSTWNRIWFDHVLETAGKLNEPSSTLTDIRRLIDEDMIMLLTSCDLRKLRDLIQLGTNSIEAHEALMSLLRDVKESKMNKNQWKKLMRHDYNSIDSLHGHLIASWMKNRFTDLNLRHKDSRRASAIMSSSVIRLFKKHRWTIATFKKLHVKRVRNIKEFVIFTKMLNLINKHNMTTDGLDWIMRKDSSTWLAEISALATAQVNQPEGYGAIYNIWIAISAYLLALMTMISQRCKYKFNALTNYIYSDVDDPMQNRSAVLLEDSMDAEVVQGAINDRKMRDRTVSEEFALAYIKGTATNQPGDMIQADVLSKLVGQPFEIETTNEQGDKESIYFGTETDDSTFVKLTFIRGTSGLPGHYTLANGTRITPSGRDNCLFDAVAAETRYSTVELRTRTANFMLNNFEGLKRAIKESTFVDLLVGGGAPSRSRIRHVRDVETYGELLQKIDEAIADRNFAALANTIVARKSQDFDDDSIKDFDSNNGVSYVGTAEYHVVGNTVYQAEMDNTGLNIEKMSVFIGTVTFAMKRSKIGDDPEAVHLKNKLKDPKYNEQVIWTKGDPVIDRNTKLKDLYNF